MSFLVLVLRLQGWFLFPLSTERIRVYFIRSTNSSHQIYETSNIQYIPIMIFQSKMKNFPHLSVFHHIQMTCNFPYLSGFHHLVGISSHRKNPVDPTMLRSPRCQAESLPRSGLALGLGEAERAGGNRESLLGKLGGLVGWWVGGRYMLPDFFAKAKLGNIF